MKSKYSLLTILFLSAGIWAMAQGGGSRRTVEERVKMVHEKMESSFSLDKDKLTKVDSIFTNFYQAQDKVREEMMGGGDRPDMQAMRAKMQPLMEARDKELKTVLTDDQFKKWKEEIEPSMMPRRGNGGGGRS